MTRSEAPLRRLVRIGMVGSAGGQVATAAGLLVAIALACLGAAGAGGIADRPVANEPTGPNSAREDWGAIAGPTDWPNWRGPHHDGLSRETGLVNSWPDGGPKILWETPLPGGYSSVAVANGRLFTPVKDGKEEIVLCFDAASGTQLWEFRYPCDYDEHATLDRRFLSGPRATPAVDGDRLYTIGTTGIVHCLRVTDGERIWHRDLMEMGQRTCPDYGYTNSPFIVGDTLFVHPGGTDGRSIAALDKRDGHTLWMAHDDRIGYATPIRIEFGGQPQVVYFTALGAVGLAPRDGRLLWRYDWTTEFDLNVATPIFAGGKLFISSNYGNGAVLLKLKPDGDPEELWKSRVMHSHFSTCVHYDGHLYGFSTDRLRCVELETGKMKWDKPGLGRGSLVLADGKLIALGDQGDLVLAAARSDEYVELARWHALDGISWSVPVLAGGRLFVRNERRMLAIDLREASQQ